jgi:predicted ThiF/HesA family dinucleotide-utilizing enzyme
MATIACYLVLSRVHFIHDFDNITPLFSDHMSDIVVPENNRVMLSKSQTEGTRDRNQTTHNGHHS